MTATPAPPATPTVSVILPTYRRPKLLRRSIASVLAQTFRDFELIVVDDHSRDETAAVVREFDDARVHYIERAQNGRAAAARNDGIAAARGQLLAFQDDDDIWLPHKLERQVRAMADSPPEVGLVVCSYVRLTKSGPRAIGGSHHFRLLDFSRGNIGNTDYSLIATPAWLVRRTALQRAGPFDTRMRSWDDWELGLRLWQTCAFRHLDEPLFVQDHVEGSAMMRNAAVFANDMKVLLEKHGHLWNDRPILQSRHYYMVGRGECGYGSVAEGRRWLLRCLRLNPLHLWAWGVLAASFFGSSGVQRASAIVRSVFRVVRWPYYRLRAAWLNR